MNRQMMMKLSFVACSLLIALLILDTADASLPANWNCFKNAEGKTYYHNNQTGFTQWDEPFPLSFPVSAPNNVTPRLSGGEYNRARRFTRPRKQYQNDDKDKVVTCFDAKNETVYKAAVDAKGVDLCEQYNSLKQDCTSSQTVEFQTMKHNNSHNNQVEDHHDSKLSESMQSIQGPVEFEKHRQHNYTPEHEQLMASITTNNNAQNINKIHTKSTQWTRVLKSKLKMKSKSKSTVPSLLKFNFNSPRSDKSANNILFTWSAWENSNIGDNTNSLSAARQMFNSVFAVDTSPSSPPPSSSSSAVAATTSSNTINDTNDGDTLNVTEEGGCNCDEDTNNNNNNNNEVMTTGDYHTVAVTEGGNKTSKTVSGLQVLATRCVVVGAPWCWLLVKNTVIVVGNMLSSANNSSKRAYSKIRKININKKRMENNGTRSVDDDGTKDHELQGTDCQSLHNDSKSTHVHDDNVVDITSHSMENASAAAISELNNKVSALVCALSEREHTVTKLIQRITQLECEQMNNNSNNKTRTSAKEDFVSESNHYNADTNTTTTINTSNNSDSNIINNSVDDDTVSDNNICTLHLGENEKFLEIFSHLNTLNSFLCNSSTYNNNSDERVQADQESINNKRKVNQLQSALNELEQENMQLAQLLSKTSQQLCVMRGQSVDEKDGQT